MSAPEMKVVFVDDDKDLLDTYAMPVDESGFRVYRAASGDEARQMIERIDFDCVVTDLSMPDGNGLKVRDAARDRGIPVIIVSGYVDDYHPALSDEDVVLPKTETIMKLVDTIRATADKKSAA